MSVNPVVGQPRNNSSSSTSSGVSVQHAVGEQTVRARSLSPGYSSDAIYRVVLSMIHLFYLQYRRWPSAVVTRSVLRSHITHRHHERIGAHYLRVLQFPFKLRPVGVLRTIYKCEMHEILCYIFGIPDTYLPIHYATFMGL